MHGSDQQELRVVADQADEREKQERYSRYIRVANSCSSAPSENCRANQALDHVLARQARHSSIRITSALPIRAHPRPQKIAGPARRSIMSSPARLGCSSASADLIS
jgi:hypothetical protein